MAPPEPTPPIVAAVRAVLAGAGDRQRARAQRAYMKSQLPYRGITAPELRALSRPILADPALQLTDRASWEDAVRELWEDATHREERCAATALTGHLTYRRWQDPDTLDLYRHLVVTGAWWDHVDEIASQRVGHNLEDPSLWIRKAIGWALRQHARTDPDWVRATVQE